MSSRTRNKGLKFYTQLFFLCCIIGTFIWYLIFASIFAKIIIPWAISVILFILWRRAKVYKYSNEEPKRKIKRYK
jgi:hypothetical protein